MESEYIAYGGHLLGVTLVNRLVTFLFGSIIYMRSFHGLGHCWDM